jgi:hypothetical protein
MRGRSQPLISSPLNPNAGQSSSAEASKEASSSSSHSNSNEAISQPSLRHDDVSRDSSYAALPVLNSSGFNPSHYNSGTYDDFSRYSIGSHLAHQPPSNGDVEQGYDPRVSTFSSFDKESLRQSMAMAAQNQALIWDKRNAEPDDYLHEPGPSDRRTRADNGFSYLKPDRICVGGVSFRGLFNVLSLFILAAGLIGLFLGYPVGYCASHSSSGHSA